MSAIDRAQVLKIAKLARLTLPEEAIPEITGQLVKVLEHIAQLEEVDTRDVEPTAQLGVERMPLRADEQKPSLDREVVLSQAPETCAFGFVVPAFVDE